MQVLIIGNDPRRIDFLTFVVRRGNLVPMIAYTVQEALALHERTPADLALMEMTADVQILVSLCREIRQRLMVPLVVITPWSDEQSQLQLYEAGADDCVTRPYSPLVLEAKIRALLRMSGWIPSATLAQIESGAVSLDPEHHTFAFAGGEPVRLTPLEFRLLYVLVLNAGHVLATETLIERVWGYTGDGNRDLLKGLVRRLRSKIEPDLREPKFIRTIAGVGYMFLLDSGSP